MTEQGTTSFGERVTDLLDRARELAQTGIADFRAQSRHFKKKTYILVGYVLIGLITVLLVLPESLITNDISAATLVGQTDIGGTYILVTNESDDDWTDLRVVVDGKWELQVERIRAGEQRELFMREFVESLQGEDADEKVLPNRAPKDHQPFHLQIRCEEGLYVGPLGIEAL